MIFLLVAFRHSEIIFRAGKIYIHIFHRDKKQKERNRDMNYTQFEGGEASRGSGKAELLF